MNIEPLYELKERLTTSAVAGISLMPEDFRLKRAIEQMEPLSKAAPIFAKIYQGAVHILEAPAEQRADALLDELALVDAVLVTQAAVGMTGELSEVNQGMHDRVVTDAPYSKVAPAMEALTTSGSGHYSFIVNLHEESPESFQDFRLRSALVKGLGAAYTELAEQIEQWLGKENESLLPFLKRGFQTDGKKEMVRRIHVIEKIAGAKENDWYLAMLKTAQKEVRETLIYALRHEKKNEELLFQLVKTEKGKAKKAAVWALTRMDSEGLYDYFKKELSYSDTRRANLIWKDEYFYLSQSEQISNLVAEEIQKELDKLEEQERNGNFLLNADEREKISYMLYDMIGKTSDSIIKVYKRLAKTDTLNKMKNAENPKEHISLLIWDGYDLGFSRRTSRQAYHLDYVDDRLTESILLTKNEKLFHLAEELYKEYGEVFLKSALIGALLSKDGETVFSEFSSYLIADGKKESSEKKAGRTAVIRALSFLFYKEERDQYVLSNTFFDAYLEKKVLIEEPIFGEFDSRWAELLTNEKLKKDVGTRSNSFWYVGHFKSWNNVLEQLIRTNDEKSCALFGKYFYQCALCAKARDFSDYYHVIRKCHFKIQPKDVVDCIKRIGRSHVYTVERMILDAPMTEEDQKKTLEMVRALVENQELVIDRWNEERYWDILQQCGQKGKEE